MMAEARLEVEPDDALVEGIGRGAPCWLDDVLQPVVQIGSELPRFGGDGDAAQHFGLLLDEPVMGLVPGLAVDVHPLEGACAGRGAERADVAAVLARPGDGSLAVKPLAALGRFPVGRHHAASAASASSWPT